MPTKQQIITIGVLCVIALGLGYWSSMPEKDSGQRTEVVAPTIITNVVREVVTNIVTANPQPTPLPVQPRPQPTPTPTKSQPTAEKLNGLNPLIEKAIMNEIRKVLGFNPMADLTHYEYEKVTILFLESKRLTDLKGLEKLTKLRSLSLGRNYLTDLKNLEKLGQLETLNLSDNRLIDLKGLEKLTKLRKLNLQYNPNLTKAQIGELQKALPNCKISSNPTK